MLIYDDTFAAAMTATQAEATALGARAYGSEHVLLGLLVADDELTRQVVGSFPALTPAAVRAAVHGALDDAPHLARLGLAAPDPTGSAASMAGRPPRPKHLPELQSALNQASAKWAHLRRTGAVPKEGKVGSTVLWLAVLELPARSPHLLRAMGIDPDGVRAAVLSAAVPAGTEAPAWPAEAPTGPFTRLVHRFFGRTNVAN
ncbi:Clp protease N-terminal domain-containing protein [Cellulomonas xiejunii]|uniref:Clp protease N-terminal domain-containing protein n=1 Tax=Cellulomonas xiejunii TaxID=2968083 RepID=UPI001D0E0100|nr:Clp protease N-terminal domain-containing protein [Cellulomonas xiejunii]MCC2314067.1 hypothetical protein [Cellulomonas xiejunii]